METQEGLGGAGCVGRPGWRGAHDPGFSPAKALLFPEAQTPWLTALPHQSPSILRATLSPASSFGSQSMAGLIVLAVASSATLHCLLWEPWWNSTPRYLLVREVGVALGTEEHPGDISLCPVKVCADHSSVVLPVLTPCQHTAQVTSLVRRP